MQIVKLIIAGLALVFFVNLSLDIKNRGKPDATDNSVRNSAVHVTPGLPDQAVRKRR